MSVYSRSPTASAVPRRSRAAWRGCRAITCPPSAATCRDDALRYLQHHVGNRSTDAILETFVDNAPRMLRHMTSNGFLKVSRMAGFPDYRAETPGGDMADDGGGRSVEPLVFAGSKLGDWLPDLLNRPRNLPFVGTMTEMRRLAAVKTDFFGVSESVAGNPAAACGAG